MNNAVFDKTMENALSNRNIKLMRTDNRKYYLVSEPNYRTKKIVFWKYVSNRNEENNGSDG